MSKVMIDLDDVICHLSKPLHEALTLTTNKNIPVTNWINYNLGTVYDVPIETINRTLIEHEVLKKVLPFKDSKDALKKLMSERFSVHIVTSRQYFDPDGTITKNWLREHEIPFDSLTLTSHMKGKSQVARELSPLLVIDDHFQNIIDCQPYSDKLFLVDRPWNREFERVDLPNIERVNCLKSSVDMLLS